MGKTLTYKEDAKGWTSFYSYDPEWIDNLNDEYFTFKNGQIYAHHKDDNDRNTFYGQTFDTKIEFVSNEGPSEVKMFRAIKTEGDSKNWDVLVESDIESGHINKSSFVERENMYYGYIRNNNDVVDTKKLTFQGLGICISVSPDTINFTELPDSTISVEDNLYKATVDQQTSEIGEMTLVGVVDTIQNNSITVKDISSMPSAGEFIMYGKNQTSESEGVRGYYAKVTMTNSSTDPVELYAVNSEVTKSNL